MPNSLSHRFDNFTCQRINRSLVKNGASRWNVPKPESKKGYLKFMFIDCCLQCFFSTLNFICLTLYAHNCILSIPMLSYQAPRNCNYKYIVLKQQPGFSKYLYIWCSNLHNILCLCLHTRTYLFEQDKTNIGISKRNFRYPRNVNNQWNCHNCS